MGFEQAGDRNGAINQGGGGPVNGEKNSHIVEHADSLSDDMISPAAIMLAHP
jgi:hypothetical protein